MNANAVSLLQKFLQNLQWSKSQYLLDPPDLEIQQLTNDFEVTAFSAVKLNACLDLDNGRHCLCPDAHAELCSALHKETTIPIQEHNPTVLPS